MDVVNTDKLLHLLRTRAKEMGKELNQILQIFCQEEFLRRIAASPYRERLVLKGGLLLYIDSGYTGRPTMDVDFLLRNLPNNLEVVEKVVTDIISQKTDGLSPITFSLTQSKLINDRREYNGAQVSLMANIGRIRVPFHVDMGIGDVIIPKAIEMQVPSLLEGFSEPTILAYSLESVIAEKFDAIVSWMEQGSRMKDYYDIYSLASAHSFDARILQEAVEATFHRRGTNYERDTFDRILTFAGNPSVTDRWTRYCKQTLNEDISLRKVLSVIGALLRPIFTAIIEEEETFGSWCPVELSYV